VLIDSSWDDAAIEAGAGEIQFRGWGQGANEMIRTLRNILGEMPIGSQPELSPLPVYATVHIGASLALTRECLLGHSEERSLLASLEISASSELPSKGTSDIFVSYAWGDDSSEDARRRTEVVDRLCETLGQDGWNIIRDKNAMRYGDLISGFIKRIGLADRVIVVLSDKYLRSPYCVTELHYIYQRSLGEKEDFLRRIIPLRLADARFGTWRERVAYAEYWEAEFKAMEEKFRHLAEADFRLYKAMQEWHNRIGDMLAYVNEVLGRHGFDEIVKDDFAALRQMLARRQ
jgi:hypothetical protein